MSIYTRVKRKIRQITAPKRFCNVCNHRFAGRFIPLPSFYIDNLKKYNCPYTYDDSETLSYNEYSCPRCGASDRDRLYALFIDRNITGSRQYNLLDIAPAPALSTFLKNKPNITYRSADLLNEQVDDQGLDIMDMKIYEDNSFDIFICSHVLEHVYDDRQAMRELLRVLKPEGFGIAMVPIVTTISEIEEDPDLQDVAERWRRFGQDDHVRVYSKQGYKDRLKESGFLVKEYGLEHFGRKVFTEHGIAFKSRLYIVHKS
ncbi:MAG: methyltransferase domain-containing protein [Chitinophagaceae bacterium]